MKSWYILFGALLLILIFVVRIFNRIKRLQLGVREAYSAMDVFLKKRYDLVPNLVEAVKGYATHEQETFEETTRARARAMQARQPAEGVAANEALDIGIGRIMILAEDYPELKANEGFLRLQEQLWRVEEDIKNARLYYNANVKLYNTGIETFPEFMFARLFGFHKEPFFEMMSEERSVPTAFGEER